jgi:putative membrane protein
VRFVIFSHSPNFGTGSCYAVGILSGLWLVNAGSIDAGRILVLFCLASHVLLGLVLVSTNRKLWLCSVGESGLALAGLVALLAG